MHHEERNSSSWGLRRRAEAILNGQEPDLEGTSPQDLGELIHELQVHQIELDLQNEALRETQDALQWARDEYAALYDAAPVGYFTVDGRGIIVRANARGAALLACSSPALVGRRFDSLVAREDQNAFHFFLVRLSHSDRPETAEILMLRSDGTPFRARVEGMMSAGEQDDNYRWRVAVSDVTVEYEARQALQRYASEQSALYSVAATLTTSLDPAELAGRVLDALLPVFGAGAGWVTAAGEVPAGPPTTLASRGIDAGDPDWVLPICRECAAFLAQKSLDWTPGESGSLVVHCDSEPGGVLAGAGLHSLVCLPLTARERILAILTLAWEGPRVLGKEEESLLLTVSRQVALSLSNAQLYQQARQVDRLENLVALDRLLSASLDVATVAGLILEHVASALQAPEALLVPYGAWPGFASGRVLIRHAGWIDLPDSETYRRWQSPLQALRSARWGAEDRPWPISRATTPWGSELIAVPVSAGDELLADLVLVGRAFGKDDVALAQAAAGRAGQGLRNARLYGEVRDLLRQRQKTEVLLIQTEKVAALGRLSASLSHEINNPLQSVLGCLGLARDRLEPSGQDDALDRYLAVAIQEIRRIAGLVHRMREFYAPRGEERLTADVEEVLARVVDLTRGEFKGRGVNLEWERKGRLPEVPMHADQIQQVFLNLILNAAEAMPRGGTVTLRTGRGALPYSGPGSAIPAVRIEVQDLGKGMPAEVQKRLFEPFFTTKDGGSGLGLYVCHHILREHGGEIEIDSREGGRHDRHRLAARHPRSGARLKPSPQT